MTSPAQTDEGEVFRQVDVDRLPLPQTPLQRLRLDERVAVGSAGCALAGLQPFLGGLLRPDEGGLDEPADLAVRGRADLEDFVADVHLQSHSVLLFRSQVGSPLSRITSQPSSSFSVVTSSQSCSTARPSTRFSYSLPSPRRTRPISPMHCSNTPESSAALSLHFCSAFLRSAAACWFFLSLRQTASSSEKAKEAARAKGLRRMAMELACSRKVRVNIFSARLPTPFFTMLAPTSSSICSRPSAFWPQLMAATLGVSLQFLEGGKTVCRQGQLTMSSSSSHQRECSQRALPQAASSSSTSPLSSLAARELALRSSLSQFLRQRHSERRQKRWWAVCGQRWQADVAVSCEQTMLRQREQVLAMRGMLACSYLQSFTSRPRVFSSSPAISCSYLYVSSCMIGLIRLYHQLPWMLRYNHSITTEGEMGSWGEMGRRGAPQTEVGLGRRLACRRGFHSSQPQLGCLASQVFTQTPLDRTFTQKSLALSEWSSKRMELAKGAEVWQLSADELPFLQTSSTQRAEEMFRRLRAETMWGASTLRVVQRRPPASGDLMRLSKASSTWVKGQVAQALEREKLRVNNQNQLLRWSTLARSSLVSPEGRGRPRQRSTLRVSAIAASLVKLRAAPEAKRVDMRLRRGPQVSCISLQSSSCWRMFFSASTSALGQSARRAELNLAAQMSWPLGRAKEGSCRSLLQVQGGMWQLALAGSSFCPLPSPYMPYRVLSPVNTLRLQLRVNSSNWSLLKVLPSSPCESMQSLLKAFPKFSLCLRPTGVISPQRVRVWAPSQQSFWWQRAPGERRATTWQSLEAARGSRSRRSRRGSGVGFIISWSIKLIWRNRSTNNTPASTSSPSSGPTARPIFSGSSHLTRICINCTRSSTAPVSPLPRRLPPPNPKPSTSAGPRPSCCRPCASTKASSRSRRNGAAFYPVLPIRRISKNSCSR